ncbi:MAG TPA: heme o synthase [Candidatus Limnocylindrales bacterium]|nr:heme o synthase [Candidatus Limnocylindrales bacterium]
MTRFQKLALTSLVATYVLVVIGAVTRSTGAGLGCPDWPLCHGQVLPPLGDTHAWIEWTHRTWAALVGLLVLALAFLAVRDHRRERSILFASIGAVLVTGFQAYLGKVTVDTQNAGEWVTAHLATAMILLALLTFVAVRARYPASLPRTGASQRFTLVLAFAAASVYALLLFGSHVTATGAAFAYPDWPLFDGQLLPRFDADPGVAALQVSHWLHRIVAVVVGVIVAGTTIAVWRNARRARVSSEGPAAQALLGLTGTAAALFGVQVIVGALQLFTSLAAWAVALHLALGALIWALFAGAAMLSYFDARVAPERDRASHGTPDDSSDPAPDTSERAPVGWRERVSAYVALTKPRIIELLLVTTVPAMVLAARGIPRLDLVAWTLVGGSLAAGAANAINCYLDRDIDLLMTRTRRRPLPAHRVEPEDALVFGLALGVVAFGLLAIFVNLVAAFLTLLAMAFYVVVYTMLLKRTTPQNIVLGGAAGALPPVIGWAAVTGDIGLPALVLFAIVFYWTPPHFWALSLRLARDYEAAGVPMLPVTHGVPETTRQIGLYSVLMVALTLVFFAVAHMGLIYLAGALLLGGLFLAQAFAMWREGTDARAIRLYRYSITYLSALFALVIVDVLIPFG